jgi:adenylate cyclase
MRRGWLAALVPLALIVGAVALRVVDPINLQDFRYKIFDGFQRLEPRSYEPAPVVVIDLDERTLEQVGQWPWPRTRVADLIAKLHNLGAPAIGLDMIFAEPDNTSPEQLVADWRDVPALRPAAEMLANSTVPSHDTLLANTLGQVNSVAGVVLSNQGTDSFGGGHTGIATIGDDPRPFLFPYDAAITNLEILDEAAAGVGALNVIPDHDGVARRVPVVLRQGEQIVPSLWAEALRVAQGASSLAIKSSGASDVQSLGRPSGVDSVRVGGATVRTDPNGQLWLYDTGPVAQRTVSAADVLDGSVDPARVRGKIALIGTSAAGLKDDQSTPLARGVPGVTLHAQAIEQAVHGSYLLRPAWAPGAEVVATLLAGLLVTGAFLTGRIGAVGLSALTILIVGGLFAGSWERFVNARQLLDPVYPALLTVACYVVTTYASFRRTEQEKRQVRQAFSFYLAPAMVERLTRQPDQLRLGGESRELTLLFCDVRGFTTLAESMTASEITSLLNRFLTPMTDAIMSANGTVDKYMGDAIMAFWNAPVDEPAHARRAIGAALEMRRRTRDLNAELKRDYELAELEPPPPLAIGVGLNTGTCSVGNMGSMQRFDYSALGDNVNLASRLEGMSKQYRVDLVFSEDTRLAAPDFPTLELDLVQVKGRTRPTRIHTVPGDELTGSEGFAALAERHAAMLAAYRGQRWDEARDLLQQCRELDPTAWMHGYYDLMAERIAILQATPPGPDWDGTFVAETK